MKQKLLAFLLMMLPSMGLAEVSFDEETNTLRITGPTDMVQVIQASNYMTEHEVKYIEMWGPGGYMRMGLQLGNRISRETTATVIIPKGKRCISACAFAAMGGSHIRIDGKLMLHRPFITNAPIMSPLEEVLAHMGKGYLMTAYYLEDHGYDRGVMKSIMEYTSPCKFMAYKDKEIKEPDDLLMWYLDDSLCEMMNSRVLR